MTLERIFILTDDDTLRLNPVWVSRWSPADRIALAGGLLVGTGRVVARDVGALNTSLGPWAVGHNACRAAMLDGDP